MNEQYRQNRPRTRSQMPPPPPPKKRFPWWTVGVIIVCGCLLLGAYVFAEDQLSGYERFQTMRSAIAGDAFFGPVYIDSIPLSGKTMQQAQEALAKARDEQPGVFELYLTAGSLRYRISSADIPLTWNTDSLLKQAYTIGRVGSLEQRYAQVAGLREPVYLTSEFTYDKSAVRAITDRAAQELFIPAHDASVVAFDVPNRTFTFSNDSVGQQVDAEKLYSDVIARLDARAYSEPLAIPLTPIEPSITRAELEKNYTKIASYTTKTTDEENRNTNIRLAAEALNGSMILPGGTISFNETTGQRTPEKGYKEAAAIENGRLKQETGGGVCQVSSTMFNALVRADAEIVTRKAHAWPSTYVNAGEDATVDWPRLDLVMRNTSATPMFITAWYENKTVTVEVYGYSLGENKRIEIESETTYTKEPDEVVYTYNEKLPIGTKQQVKKPRTGYSVQTYKLWYDGDTLAKREPFYKSEYAVIYEEYEYNDGNPPPEV